MSRNTLLIDAATAVLFAVVVLIVSPGLAIAGILALVVLVVCMVSFVLEGRRRARQRGRRPRPPSRAAGPPVARSQPRRVTPREQQPRRSTRRR